MKIVATLEFSGPDAVAELIRTLGASLVQPAPKVSVQGVAVAQAAQPEAKPAPAAPVEGAKPAPRGRGRPPGSPNKPKPAAPPVEETAKPTVQEPTMSADHEPAKTAAPAVTLADLEEALSALFEARGIIVARDALASVQARSLKEVTPDKYDALLAALRERM